jgi:hypothetical protein
VQKEVPAKASAPEEVPSERRSRFQKAKDRK